MDALSKDSLAVRLFGNSNVVFSTGDLWKHQRKAMNPVFHRTVPVDLFGRMIPDIFKLIEKTDGNVLVDSFLQKITFDALGRALFGFDFKTMGDDDSEWIAAYNDAMSGITAPILQVATSYERILRHFYPHYDKASKGIDKLNKLILDMVDEKKKKIEESKGQPDAGHEKDFLTLILEAEMKENAISDPDDLRVSKTKCLSGHLSTASSIAFCIYHMAINKASLKDIQNKARREALDILGDDDSMVPPTVAECKRVNYINMLVKEVLRLCSPFGAILERMTAEDVTLSGAFIPKGTLVSVDIEALHKNPAIWKNPTVFDPERFRKGGEYDQHKGITWAPFSDGNRKCLGVNFSMAEQQVVLLMLLKHYEWDLPENSIHKNGIVYDSIFSFTPKSLSIKFHKRH
ncbi:CYP509 protein [Phycomyces blakesleeanus NRRL 1555(-)]|uniref:CYP509 protein n=1 Tax=Phycomyces blakesleeanus (strain ATCC 8743b / DSM 1359 / FGSC 10004 / NBRC 33097 / NRRL 1555) TaxID=763407 RepID=A0A167PC51_PHYB8|nr:CYP509 protein [Phycomyces blakesleeanus NRRL 1555(-)]OAD77646.1 CYP509 protein [Phycomyces blakesleeanus NRRL 1555(-)]|eukprot:XP_018295686.1 CYP509 protein [Phycomyces blakesleeanus NRRL 1555(-)]